MLAWFDIYPERLDYELHTLSAMGFEVDQHELEREHRLVMRGSVSTVRGDVDVTIVYPDSFPYLRPEVFAKRIALERHHHPYDGNLCLLDRNSRAWDVDLTGAWLVRERVPYLLELLEAGGDALLSAETPQGEPVSSYFGSQPGTTVFVGEEALHLPVDAHHGHLQLAYGRAEAPNVLLRAALRRVTTKDGNHGQVLANAEEALARRFDGKKIEGRWVRLDQLPAENSPQALLAAAIAACPDLRRARYADVSDGQMDVVGCVFPEEVRQNEWQDTWLFVVRHRRRISRDRAQDSVFVVRGDRMSLEDLSARIPNMRDLRCKHVAVIGLGALGAPVALELARNGVSTLSILDFDRVEVGNGVRWPVGLTAVGHHKTDVIASTILNDFPYTEVHQLTGRVGDTGNLAALHAGRTRTELDVLRDFVANVDLVIDATAEVGIQHFVSWLVRERPVIYAWATEGAAGGAVVRTRADGGCWLCLQHAIQDGTVALPPADEQATAQPRGCAAPTFTGHSFDLLPLVAQVARVAVATLRDPLAAADVSIMSLRDGEGRPTPGPSWQFQSLEVHARCVSCAYAYACADAAA